MSREYRVAKVEIFDDITMETPKAIQRAIDQTPGLHELRLLIDTDGGPVAAMAPTFSAIQNCRDNASRERRPFKVVTINLGRASSLGGLFFAIGDDRLTVPDGAVMLHEAHRGGDPDGGASREYTAAVLDWYAARTKIARPLLSLWASQTTYFNAGHCLRLKLATGLSFLKARTKVDVSARNQPFTASAELLAARQRVDDAQWLLNRANRLAKLGSAARPRHQHSGRQTISLPPMPKGVVRTYSEAQRLIFR